jgi:hypothetical protein
MQHDAKRSDAIEAIAPLKPASAVRAQRPCAQLVICSRNPVAFGSA